MSVNIDTRVIRITRWLLDQHRPRSTAELAAELGLSQRVVRYRLDQVERYLHGHGAELVRRQGLGLIIEASDDLREQIMADLLSRPQAPRVYAPEERARLLLAALLWTAPSISSLEELHEELEVSKTSARRDLHVCESWLERNGLPLVRRPGRGISVVGTERRIRQVMVQFTLESVPEDVLRLQMGNDERAREQSTVRVPVGLRERLFTLPLAETAAIVRRSTLGETLTSGRSDVVFALFLAVSITRLQAGHRVSVEAGLHRSVMDHPVAASVLAMVSDIEQVLGSGLPVEEVAAITEYLLGLDALDAVSSETMAITQELFDRVISTAGERLHIALGDDRELRRSLALHLGRLSVRLRHGLPIHNPLRDEVTARYPDVYSVAGEIATLVEVEMGLSINDDEVCFITMYLAGAMERARLHPRRRALVVCPSGMATAWVLVSRIQAEFPELELVEVLSESGYEALSHDKFDLVITTITLKEINAPVVVVSPLLSASAVARVARYT